VPAVEISFSDETPPPSGLYLDSDILIAAVVSTHEHFQRAARLFELLVKYGATSLYLCPVSWMEYAHVFSKEAFRRTLPSEFAYLNPVTGWHDASVRQRYFEFVVSTLEDVLSPFAWHEIPTTIDINRAAIGYMARYNMDAQDAVHLASARAAGLNDLASFDRIFRRVDGLNLWNDQIYGRR
jgi:predicted nucleic acid-binding protein